MTAAAAPTRQADPLVVAIAYLGFIVLGIPGALLGVATPSIRENFALTLDTFGLLFIATTSGYFLASVISGRLFARFGAAAIFGASAVVSAVGLLGYIISPSWLIMLAFGVVAGLGAGLLDAGMNIYFAAHFGPRLMNWLHACFGIGATIGPLLMTFILNAGGTWRTGYIMVGGLYGGLALLFFLTQARWGGGAPQSKTDAPAPVSASAQETLRLPIVWVGILLFIAYAGLEMSAGQWAFSLFTEARSVDQNTAGLWVSIYWGSFTVGRIVFGAIVTYVKPATLIRACTGLVLVGALLLWWNPIPESGLIALSLYGFALAPIFALLVTNTQDTLGPKHGPNAIGFQVGAASLGLGVLPGLIGVLAEATGSLEVVPPILLVLVAIMAILYELTHNPRLAHVRDDG
ncbi:MAG: MFS transporter [Anaerolineae bacterium]|nr:MFS transporter [Anaerolineae bacterium]